MSLVSVHKIVSKLMEDTELIRSYNRFAVTLGVQSSDYVEIEFAVNNGTVASYHLIKKIIELWLISKNDVSDDPKTIGLLSTKCLEMELVYLSEVLINSFGSETVIEWRPATWPSHSSCPQWINPISWSAVLGDGGFGIVFRYEERNGIKAAVKFVPLVGSDEQSKMETLRAEREYRYIKNKSHPNIVGILDSANIQLSSTEISEINGRYSLGVNQRMKLLLEGLASVSKYNHISTFLIKMELCGENLRAWIISRQPDSMATVRHQRQIVYGMLRGMKYLHSCKIIHRDIRPENILFARQGFTLPIKLADFGLARRFSNESDVSCTPGKLTKGVGVLAYMAPEVSTGDYDQSADYYSMGITIWETLYFLRASERDHKVHRLVQLEEDVVAHHPHFVSARRLIIAMTKRVRDLRISDVREYVPDTMPENEGVSITVPSFQLTFWEDFGSLRWKDRRHSLSRSFKLFPRSQSIRTTRTGVEYITWFNLN